MPGLHAFSWEPAPEKKMPFNPFSALTSKIFGGLALALLLAVAVQTVRVEHLKRVVAVLRIDLGKIKEQRDQERRNHVATKQAYRDAQAAAERMEAERLARVTAEQERINNDRLAAYNRRLADARVQYQRLRSQAGTRTVGAPHCQPVPDAGHSPAVAQAACGDELSAAERLIATEQSIQLDELITAVEQHRAVPVN